MFSKLLKKYNNSSETLRASLWYTICNVMTKGFALLSAPVFSHLLTEEEYGTFTIFQSWSSILIIFTSLNIFLGGYTKGLLLFKGKENEFTSASLGLTTVMTLVYFIVYCINIPFWTDFFELPPHMMIGMFGVLLLIPALDFWAARMRFDYKYKNYVIVTLAMSFISLGSGVLCVVLLSHKLDARVFTDVITKCVFSGVIFVMLFARGKKVFDKKYWLYSLKFNIPLLPHYLSNYILSQSDRLMIGKMVGKAQAGIYGVAYTISTMMNLVVTAINNALNPFIFKSLDKKDYESVKRTTRPLFVLIAGLSLLTMAFAPELTWIFGRSYHEAIYIIPPIAVSVYFIFLYAMFSSVEYYFQRTVQIAVATTISAGTNFVLNYICIKQFGYFAAGYTTLVCYLLLAVAHYVFYRRILKNDAKTTELVYDDKIIVITSIGLLAGMFLMLMTYHIIWIRYSLILLAGIVAVWKKDLIKNTLLSFKK